MVIVHHIEQLKFIFGMESGWETSGVIRNLGKLGVLLFFTLSGFLITYLLLQEEKITGSINIKQFYIRRVLRIWPLYFLVFFLAYFVLNRIPFFQHPGFSLGEFNPAVVLLLFCLFLSNVFVAFVGALPYASQTWSVSVEEQFYLFWPLLIKFTKKRINSILVVIFLIVAVRMVLLLDPLHLPIEKLNKFRTFWNLFNIDCMGIGALTAIVLFHQNALLKYLLNAWVFIITTLAAIMLITFNVKIPVISGYFENDLYACLFAVLILNLSSNALLTRVLEFKWLSYLGKISYGLYMYHAIAVVIAIKLVQHFSVQSDAIIYTVTFAITITISAFSYRFFESPLLKIKEKFSSIHTIS